MTTPLSLLCQLCGLSHREAADYLGVSLDTVKAWSNGRNRTPPSVLVELATLAREIDDFVAGAMEILRSRGSTLDVNSVFRAGQAVAGDQHWPCAGVHRAAMARVLAGAILDGMTVI